MENETYITIKHEGILRPKAILEKDDKWGIDEVKKYVEKNKDCKVVRVKVIEVDESIK